MILSVMVSDKSQMPRIILAQSEYFLFNGLIKENFMSFGCQPPNGKQSQNFSTSIWELHFITVLHQKIKFNVKAVCLKLETMGPGLYGNVHRGPQILKTEKHQSSPIHSLYK